MTMTFSYVIRSEIVKMSDDEGRDVAKMMNDRKGQHEEVQTMTGFYRVANSVIGNE